MRNHPGILLIGSVAMDSAESVFRALAGELGPWLKRVPDGETGQRSRWIFWQRQMLVDHPDMEFDTEAEPLIIRQWDGKLVRDTELVRFKPGVNPESVVFETGYADAARSSYEVFKRLRDEGAIPQGVRFQVSLPTPFASGYMYVSRGSLEAYMPVYEKSLLTAVDDILASIPHEDLSIQWDICQEVLIFENYFEYRVDNYKEQIYTGLARLGDHIPEDVEVGYHFCYGSPLDEHLIMPKDLGISAEMVNGLVSKLRRRLDFVHVPVPKERTDDAYFAPLSELKMPDETELYLGLVHYDDREGDLARIAAAKRCVSDFGYATECGWGRTAPERVPELITSHRLLMEQAAS